MMSPNESSNRKWFYDNENKEKNTYTHNIIQHTLSHSGLLVCGHAKKSHEHLSMYTREDFSTPQGDWGRGLVWAGPVTEVGVQQFVEGSIVDYLTSEREYIQ